MKKHYKSGNSGYKPVFWAFKAVTKRLLSGYKRYQVVTTGNVTSTCYRCISMRSKALTAFTVYKIIV